MSVQINHEVPRWSGARGHAGRPREITLRLTGDELKQALNQALRYGYIVLPGNVARDGDGQAVRLTIIKTEEGQWQS